MLSGVQQLIGGLGNVALITPSQSQFGGYQPLGPAGASSIPNGPTFFFHIEGEQKMEMRTDITDHYIETNSAIQDHAALPPIKFLVHGFIGELADLITPSQNPVVQLNSNLIPIAAFAPPLSLTAQNLLDDSEANYNNIQQLANTALAAWNSLAGQGTQSKQQAAFQWWANARLQRYLFNIQTPWVLMQNMMPESIMPVQPEDSPSITDFFITFKEIRFSTTTVTPTAVLDGRSGQATSPTVFQGTSTPSPSSTSFPSTLQLPNFTPSLS